MTEKVAIVGGRNFPELEAVRRFVLGLPMRTTIISGGASGVDSMAASTARFLGRSVEELLPPYGDWPPKIAPKVRNWDIARTCDRMVAFWDGQSSGTAHAIACAVTEGKPVRVLLADRIAEWDSN